MEAFFSLGMHALPDFGLTSKHEMAYAPLALVRCSRCALVQLAHTVDRDSLFRRYWYKSGISETMRAALADIAEAALIYGRLTKDDIIVDIGANDGTLLSSIPSDVQRVAFEPSSIDPTENAPGCTRVHDYFTADNYQSVKPTKRAKVITSIAMFYSVEDPDAFVRDVADVLHPSGVWILQMNDLLALVESMAYDIIGHEHVAIWSLHALKRLLDEHGLECFRVERNHVNGGSIRCYIQHKNGGWRKELTVYEQMVAESQLFLPAFARRYAEATLGLRETLSELKESGAIIYGYGASTRGCTILQASGINANLITGIADRDPSKHGFLMPGTDIPIVSEEEMRKERPDYLLALPYSYMKQFREREADFIKRGGKFIVPLPEVRIV